MEVEALRLYKILFDMNCEGEISTYRGIELRSLLEKANSEYTTESIGKDAMIGLLYYLVKCSCPHFSFTLKKGRSKVKERDGEIQMQEEYGILTARLKKLSVDIEKAVTIMPIHVEDCSSRSEKLMGLMYFKAKNFDTYMIYKYIKESGAEGTTYAQITQKYNETYGPEKQLSAIKVANYCKKMLEKNGFIKSFQSGVDSLSSNKARGTEKVVALSKYCYKDLQETLFDFPSERKTETCIKAKKRLLNPDQDEKMSPPQKEKVVENREELEGIRMRYEGLPMRQIVGQSIKSSLAQENGGLTIGEIAYILNMEQSTKAVNRVLENMTSLNPLIYGSTEGSGKIRFNKYLFSEAEYKPQIEKPVTPSEAPAERGMSDYYLKFLYLVKSLESGQKNNPIIDNLNPLLDLNPSSYDIMQQKLEQSLGISFKSYKPETIKNANFKKLVVKTVLVEIIEGSTDQSKKQKKKRELTSEVLNRYIYSLNKIEEMKVITFIDITNMITKDLEKAHGTLIARKTVKKIVKNLEESNLLRCATFTVNLAATDPEKGAGFFTRYVLYAMDVDPADERIRKKSVVEPKAAKPSPSPLPEEKKVAGNEGKVEVNPEACKIDASEMRKILLCKILPRIHYLRIRSAFERLLIVSHKGVIHKKLLNIFTSDKKPESCFGKILKMEKGPLFGLDIWKSEKIPLVPKMKIANEPQSLLALPGIADSFAKIDEKIKTKEKKNSTGLAESLGSTMEYLQSLKRNGTPVSLALVLKKCKGCKSGLKIIDILQANGIISIDSNFIEAGQSMLETPYQRKVPSFFKCVSDQQTEENAKKELNISPNELLTELKKEEVWAKFRHEDQ